MNPRLEYALLAGVLASALAVVTGLLLEADGSFVRQMGVVAGIAALASAGWVGGWRWLLGAGHGGWRLLGVSFFTVLVAFGLFYLQCMALFAIVEGGGFDVMKASGVAALVLMFAALLGGLPALLLVAPLAWCFLRRHDRKVAA